MPTWLHFASKIHQNCVKNRSREASKKQFIFVSVFNRFVIDFGTQLGAMLATFSARMKRCCGSPPLFLLRCFFEPIFFEILTHLGFHVAPFWCQVGSMLAPCCCHFGAKLAVSWATWPHELALDGLVGLREALRICF